MSQRAVQARQLLSHTAAPTSVGASSPTSVGPLQIKNARKFGELPGNTVSTALGRRITKRMTNKPYTEPIDSPGSTTFASCTYTYRYKKSSCRSSFRAAPPVPNVPACFFDGPIITRKNRFENYRELIVSDKQWLSRSQTKMERPQRPLLYYTLVPTVLYT